MAPCRSGTTHTSIFLSPRGFIRLVLWSLDFHEISNLSHVEIVVKGLYLPIFGLFCPFCSLLVHFNGILNTDPQFFGLKLVSCWKFCMIFCQGDIYCHFMGIYWVKTELKKGQNHAQNHWNWISSLVLLTRELLLQVLTTFHTRWLIL